MFVLRNSIKFFYITQYKSVSFNLTQSLSHNKEVYEFIAEQPRKGYIRPLKLPQIVLVFFMGKKDRKKRMV